MNKKSQQENKRQIVAASQHYSGPIPDPESLAKYEQIMPGAAERILRMAENEAKNRHKNENRLTKSYLITTILGIIFAFSSVVLICGLVYYALKCGFGTEAAGIAVGAIASVAGVFMFFKRSNRKNEK
ncbi:MAG: DUF2335 domain-containing protein [Bacteroidales bacterium]|jgi:uncharacterized membrane protein|nr:DUF2335 domain-containing protein [Bacteroidales bacterium]